jgi:hypothetical protein
MNLAYQSLLMLVLFVSEAVALFPLFLRGTATPALHSPIPSPAPVDGGSSPLWLVETPQGQWSVNGDRLSSTDLGHFLQRRTPLQRVHYLPSDALSFEKVSRSMRWLKKQSPAPVVLELPYVARPLSP